MLSFFLSLLGVAAFNHNCTLAYIEIGSNRGDSLESFAQGKPDPHVRAALESAMPGWSPLNSCVYGFEPNPAWTSTLHEVQRRIGGSFSALRLYVETAVVDDNRTKVQLFVDPSRLSEGSSIAHGKGRKVTLVKAINLHEWLISKFVRRALPLVIRIDVEGFEYMLLRSLLSSGTASHFPPHSIHLAVEWHRYVKHASIGTEQVRMMSGLDDNYKWVRGKNEPLEDTLEKQLHYWLESAGVRLFY